MGTSRLTSSPLSLLCCVVDESSLNRVRLVTRGAPRATTSAAEGPQSSGWIDVRGSDIFICVAFSHTHSYIHTYKAGLVKSCARVNAPAIVCVCVCFIAVCAAICSVRVYLFMGRSALKEINLTRRNLYFRVGKRRQTATRLRQAYTNQD